MSGVAGSVIYFWSAGNGCRLNSELAGIHSTGRLQKVYTLSALLLSSERLNRISVYGLGGIHPAPVRRTADCYRRAAIPAEALSPSKKNCAIMHSFLDKDFNTVYLLRWSFFAWL